MIEKFETIIGRLFFQSDEYPQITTLNIIKQFQPNLNDKSSIAKSINAAFLILLSGQQNPLYKDAQQYLNKLENKEEWSDMVYFYLSGLKLIEMEITKKTTDDVSFNEKINNLYLQLKKNTTGEKFLDINDKIWTVFFPEGVSLLNPEKRPPKIAELQEKRKVSITSRFNTTALHI